MQWWVVMVALLLGIAIVVLFRPSWVKTTVLVLCVIILTIVDYLVVRHIRAKHPRPEQYRNGEPDPGWNWHSVPASGVADDGRCDYDQ